ncbi:hypothetical protein H4K35_15030 [Myroides sp. NP-2]|uniref:hypothetical protein n=1 Tax=Myroides sp. NP-2 TaxID=2759945 RepID=UPI0015FA7ECF|nr:hypothetical protein [Myroides sp. NP-2]MBB1151398.1 hypothetical protein [Myroides sp. NP-2]
MDFLKNINIGFKLKDGKKINENLNQFFVQNKSEISFQKHPLGFKYYKLGNISNSEEFRLHFWINTFDKHDNDLQIHDHSFDFESYVLNGCIVNNRYKIISSNNYNGYVYDVKFRNEKSKLILNQENCSILLEESVNINCGEFYKMPSNDFHESVNNEELTVTLLKITKSENKIARVFSPKKLISLDSYERVNLTFEENNKLIDKIITLTKTV